ncbi:Uncharacterised protein [Citrobacter freundii]|nr:Uncharacterised protein [Citrobacter freundii]
MLLVRRPDSPINSNKLNFKQLIYKNIILYTHMYTQLLSFKNQRSNITPESSKR